MSGGQWDYKNDSTAWEIFGYVLSPDYGEKGFEQSKAAAKLNPLQDAEISELVWDVFCLLHSYDWYASADTGESSYRADVKRFKEKWFGKTEDEHIKKVVDNALEGMKDDLYKTFGLWSEND